MQCLTRHCIVHNRVTTRFNINTQKTTREEEKHQILRLDSAASAKYAVAGDLGDPTRSIAMNMDEDFANWFRRPIKADTINWEIGMPFNINFNPWTMFFENPRVINRINNYNLLRARLCVKFVVNGNSFYYGRAIASYVPLQNEDDFAANLPALSEALILKTQRPHIYIDPTHSEAGTLCLPFVWPDNALSIPLAQWREMGKIEVDTMNVLKHANGGTDGIEIAVFIWADEIELSVPTSADSTGLVPQSGRELDPTRQLEMTNSPTWVELRETQKEIHSIQQSVDKLAKHLGYTTRRLQSRISILENMFDAPDDEIVGTFEGESYQPHSGKEDEFGKGPISRVATSVAHAAGMLRKVPLIGPYMMPTEMVARATATIAAAFGFSRPAIISDISGFTPRYVGDMASTARPDTVVTLATEPKQSVTVDPRVVGVGADDEMTIESIACREGFLTNFPWADASAADTLLFQVQVTPMLWDELAGAGNQTPALFLPPCAFASMPFENWHGCMEYHFQFVCSSFHRGRVRIVYEPQSFESNEYNTNFSRVVDIQSEKDVTIKVGWGDRRPFITLAQPGNPGSGGGGPPFSNNPLLGLTSPFDNGILRVYVLNELTTPNSVPDNDIEVNVYVKCSDGCEWANPRNLDAYSYGNTPQSGRESPTSVLSYFSHAWTAPSIPDKTWNRLRDDLIHLTYDGYLDKEDLCELVTRLARHNVENLRVEQPRAYQFIVQNIETFMADFENMSAADLVDIHSGLLTMAARIHFCMSRRNPQSGESPEEEDASEHVLPMKESVDDEFAGQYQSNDYMRVFFGEEILSFRSLLKRYNLHSTLFSLALPSSVRTSRWTMNAFPRYAGFIDGGEYTGTLNGSSGFFNPVKTTLMNYLTPAFVCRRGAIRYKSVYTHHDGTVPASLSVERLTGGAVFGRSTNNMPINGDASMAQVFLQASDSGMTGLQATAPQENPVLEFEVPYQTPARFSFARNQNLSIEGFAENAFRINIQEPTRTTQANGYTRMYVAAGEDFSLSFYIGPPRLYFTPNVPSLS